jgi:cell division protein FtsN
MEADLGAKGTWFRVRVGAFGDKDSANRFQKDVERELRVAAVVMPTR